MYYIYQKCIISTNWAKAGRLTHRLARLIIKSTTSAEMLHLRAARYAQSK